MVAKSLINDDSLMQCCSGTSGPVSRLVILQFLDYFFQLFAPLDQLLHSLFTLLFFMVDQSVLLLPVLAVFGRGNASLLEVVSGCSIAKGGRGR